MTELTQTTILRVESNTLVMRLYQVHPDATITYFEEHGNENLPTTGLYFLADLLERTDSKDTALYQFLYNKVRLIDTIGDFDEITDIEGTWFLRMIADEVLTSAGIVSSNFNENWENGLFDELSYTELLEAPYLQNIPSIDIELIFKEQVDLSEIEGLSTDTSLDTALVEWL